MNITPTFGKIEPTEQTQTQNITFDEAGIAFDEVGYTFDGLSGSGGNSPKVFIKDLHANINIKTITPTL